MWLSDPGAQTNSTDSSLVSALKGVVGDGDTSYMILKI